MGEILEAKDNNSSCCIEATFLFYYLNGDVSGYPKQFKLGLLPAEEKDYILFGDSLAYTNMSLCCTPVVLKQ